MKTKVIFLVYCLLTWVQIEAQVYSILEQDKHSLILEFQLESYEIEQMAINGETIDIIKAKKCGYFNVAGEPALPYYAKSIIIPDFANPKIEIQHISIKEIKVNRIVPSKGSLPVGVDADQIPFTFGDVYNQDKWYPEANTEIGEPYIIRDISGVVLYINPFIYNPKQQILKIATSITIKVTYGESLDFVLKNISHEFSNIYKNHFINYSYYEGKISRCY